MIYKFYFQFYYFIIITVPIIMEKNYYYTNAKIILQGKYILIKNIKYLL